MGRLPVGKIPIEVLDSTVLRYTGAESGLVVTPARAGVDFAAVRLKDRFMIVSADPITGVTKGLGRLAMRVSANDVATSGNRPQFAESVVLLPDGSGKRELERISKEIHAAAKESGIAIVGGHTEVTPGIGHPIIVTTVFSFVEKFVTSAGAKDGDAILMTKTAGVEGTSELAAENKTARRTLPRTTLARARKMKSMLDVTEEATAAFATGTVHAMHDCTEGGVLGALFEMSLASGLGFAVDEESIPVAPETAEICMALSIDPLRLIGSGSLLIAVEEGGEEEVRRALKPICRVSKIGRFVDGQRTLLRKDGRRVLVRRAPEDELWRVLSGRARRRDRL